MSVFRIMQIECNEVNAYILYYAKVIKIIGISSKK